MPYPYQNVYGQQYPNMYGQQYPNAYQQNMQQYQQPVNGITKVNGRDSALQYQLPPNSMSPALFDNDGKTFYIVSTDGTGMKTVETFDFFPHVEEKSVNMDDAKFVSKEEYDQFVSKVSAALEALNGVHAAVPTTTTRRVANGTQGADVDAEADDARRPLGAR